MKHLCLLFIVVFISSTHAQNQSLEFFKTKLLEKKKYAGVVLKNLNKEINPGDFMADIEGNSDNWIITIAGDTINSSYETVENGLFVRIYMQTDIKTGKLISLKRNSSGTIYWWSETWTSSYVLYQNYETKEKKLEVRQLNQKEKKCVRMFEIVTQIVTETFTTGNSQIDSILYFCFEDPHFGKDLELEYWKSGILNSLFEYRFTADGMNDDQEGFFEIDLNLLSGEYTENFKYFTVKPSIVEETASSLSIRNNPDFDREKHVKIISREGILIPHLLVSIGY